MSYKSYSNYLGSNRCCNTTGPGSKGAQGAQGAGGAIGPMGAMGSPGVTGAQGPPGAGSSGSTGSGPQGDTGPVGPQGATGIAGLAGATGPQGATGSQGDTGSQGATGPQGATGNTGSQGDTGSQGATGAQGATGGSPWTTRNAIGPQGAGYTGTGYTGDVLINGNLLVTGVIDPTNVYIVSGKTGGASGPMLVLNQTNTVGQLIATEFYNSRTAVPGEFNRMSFYAKSSTGLKIEYGRIHQNAVITTTGSTRGRMDFAVDVGGVMTDFLTLNASANSVSCLRSLNMNNFGISSCPDIATPNGLPYGKVDVNYYNTPTGNFPLISPSVNTRTTLFNTGGLPTTLDPYGSGGFSTWGATTASTNFNGSTYVGTDNGFVYYSSDGVTWGQVNVAFSGAIRGMKEFNGYLYIVGDFNTEGVSSLTCNGIAKIDSSNNFFQITWSNVVGNGFNAKVRCLETSASGYLYIGGDFNNTDTGSLSMGYIAIVDSMDSVFCMDNSAGTGYGFDNSVYFIKENINAPNVLIIGGSFNNISTAFGGFSVTLNAIWTTTGSYDTNGASTPYQVVSFNAVPRCITSNGSQNYIGGDFTGLTYGDYLVTFEWSGASYIEAIFPTSFGSSTTPVDLILQDGGVYFTNTALQLYETGVLAGTSPTSSNWSAIIAGIWGQKIFSTISASQNPYIGYIINSSQAITISLVAPYLLKASGVTYTGGINLNSVGSNVDMIYNSSETAYYVVTYFGGVGFF